MKTKFNLKLLLLVSILLIAMCLFNTNMVQATNVTTQAEYDTLKSKVESLMPDTITLDITESEALIGSSDEIDGNRGKAVDLVQAKFNELLKANNISLPITFTNGNTTETTNYNIDFCGANDYEAQADWKSYVDIHKMCIYTSSESTTGGSSGSAGGELKQITIKYSETDNTKALNSLTDTITLDIKESEIDLNIETDHENTTLSKVDTIIRKQLTDKGYDVSTLVVAFTSDGFEPVNIHEVYVTLGLLGQEKSRTIKVNYSNTLQYNKTDETYVKSKLDSIKFAKVYDNDSIVQVYNVGDEESASKWTWESYKTYNYNSLINDNSITIKATMGAGGQGGGTPWGHGVILYFFKNNVLYQSKNIGFWGMYGITLENGTPVNMAKLEKDDEVYKAMAKELEKNGLKNIIGCYELEAFGTTYKDMKVSFNIGTNYNGKEVKILHKKSDNTYETFTTKVENGKATITVSEFSPFMIALNDTTNNRKLDNEPKTGVADYTVFASIVALISLGGLVTLKFKK